jgi:ABC-type uncharacterized transport system substrate-binding protein
MQWALDPALDGLGLALKDLRFDHLGLDLPHSVGSLTGSLQPGCEASIIIGSTETATRYQTQGRSSETPRIHHAARLTRVAVVMNPEQAPQAGMLRAVEAVASALGVKTSSLSVRDPIERGFASFAQEQHGGLVVLPNPVADVNRELIVRTATRHGLPAIYAYRYYVASGGLMSLGIDTADQFKQAASYVDRILKGAKPAELPVQQPTKFELVINLKTAKALGLDVSPMLLARADEVIE